MVHRIKKVEYVDGYTLKVFFTNRKVRILDLSEELKTAKNLFLDLLELDFFKQVTCDGFSIVWPNGIDFCPDWVYMNSVDLPRTKRTKKLAVRQPKRTKGIRRKVARK